VIFVDQWDPVKVEKRWEKLILLSFCLFGLWRQYYNGTYKKNNVSEVAAGGGN
jgi:hypothetical protein